VALATGPGLSSTKALLEFQMKSLEERLAERAERREAYAEERETTEAVAAAHRENAKASALAYTTAQGLDNTPKSNPFKAPTKPAK
jgi:hypothetical protein